MKKHKALLGAVAVVLAIALAGSGIFGIRSVRKRTQARNRAIGTAVNACITDYTKGSDSDLLNKVVSRSLYSVKDIRKSGKTYKVELRLESRDLGSEVARFREKNTRYLNAEQIETEQRYLLAEAEDREADFSITAAPENKEKTAYKIALSPAFVNAYLGYVYDENETKAKAFVDTAVEDFDRAVDISVPLQYHFEDIDKIVKAAGSLAVFNQKLYYSVYTAGKTADGKERYTKALKCYDIETRETATLYTYDDYLGDISYSLHYADCLNGGALIGEEALADDFTETKNAYLYDYKDGALREIRCNPDVSVFSSAIFADCQHGTVYLAEGQDGAGDIYRFTPEDEAMQTAVSAGDGYLYLNSLAVQNENIYMGLLDAEAFQSGTRKYNLCVNDGTSVGKTLVRDMDGKLYSDGKSTLYYFKDGKLASYDTETGEESAPVTPSEALDGAEVRLLTGDTAYVQYRGDDGACLCRMDIKTGKVTPLGTLSQSVVKGY